MKTWIDYCAPDLLEIIRAAKRPENRSINGSIDKPAVYRGKMRHVVGYSWSNKYSHHINGIVHDCVLGWGDTRSIAIDKARSKVIE